MTSLDFQSLNDGGFTDTKRNDFVFAHCRGPAVDSFSGDLSNLNYLNYPETFEKALLDKYGDQLVRDLLEDYLDNEGYSGMLDGYINRIENGDCSQSGSNYCGCSNGECLEYKFFYLDEDGDGDGNLSASAVYPECSTPGYDAVTKLVGGKNYSTTNNDCYEHGPHSDLIHGNTEWIPVGGGGSKEGCRPPESEDHSPVKYKIALANPEIICSTSETTGSTTCEVGGVTFTY